jgi:putative addiction module killer protein
MKYELERTSEFDVWLGNLKDKVARKAIVKRLIRLEAGNFGDCKSVGDKVSELRFFIGPGYRIYYSIIGNKLVLLLLAGTKGSQQKDIKTAKVLLEHY